MLRVIMLNAIILSVVMLSFLAPFGPQENEIHDRILRRLRTDDFLELTRLDQFMFCTGIMLAERHHINSHYFL
jgi:hypothetical protein